MARAAANDADKAHARADVTMSRSDGYARCARARGAHGADGDGARRAKMQSTSSARERDDAREDARDDDETQRRGALH
jgi:hypothetical protein